MEQRDERLGAALRSALGSDEPDWNALRARIGERAALPLARRRRAGRATALRWAGGAIPVAAALAAVYVARLSPTSSGEPAARVAIDSSHAPPTTIEAVVRASVSRSGVDGYISGEADAEALLRAAIGEADGAGL